MDGTTIIAIASLAVSLGTALGTTWLAGKQRLDELELTQRYEKESQEQVFFYQHRAEVIERYIQAVGSVVYNGIGENDEAFGKAAGEMYLYVDQSHWHWLDQIRDEISSNEMKEAEDSLVHLCKELNSSPPRSQPTEKPRNENEKKRKYKCGDDRANSRPEGPLGAKQAGKPDKEGNQSPKEKP